MTMEKVLYKSCSIDGVGLAGPFAFCLEYYILEKEAQIEGFSIVTYGVEIDERDPATGEIVDYQAVYDVFCSRAEAEMVVERLARGEVTPATLMDVLQDTVGIGDLVNRETMAV